MSASAVLKKTAVGLERAAALAEAQSLLGRVSLAPRSAPYNLTITCAGGAEVHVAVRATNGRVGVTVRMQQHRRLAAIGGAYLVNGTLIPLSALVGTAHVHLHRLDRTARSVVFRVEGGLVMPPRWCFGDCHGALAE